jgi:hypothetical protein
MGFGPGLCGIQGEVRRTLYFYLLPNSVDNLCRRCLLVGCIADPWPAAKVI